MHTAERQLYPLCCHLKIGVAAVSFLCCASTLSLLLSFLPHSPDSAFLKLLSTLHPNTKNTHSTLDTIHEIRSPAPADILHEVSMTNGEKKKKEKKTPPHQIDLCENIFYHQQQQRTAKKKRNVFPHAA